SSLTPRAGKAGARAPQHAQQQRVGHGPIEVAAVAQGARLTVGGGRWRSTHQVATSVAARAALRELVVGDEAAAAAVAFDAAAATRRDAPRPARADQRAVSVRSSDRVPLREVPEVLEGVGAGPELARGLDEEARAVHGVAAREPPRLRDVAE